MTDRIRLAIIGDGKMGRNVRDLAPGAGHFRLPLARGREIYAALARRVGGPALPTYVLDLPGGFGKARVAEAEAARRG